MAIDFRNETILRFNGETARAFPGSKKPSRPTLFRWASVGLNGVRLETFLIGVQRFCSQEAVERFIERLNESGDDQQVAPITATQRSRQDQAAKAELAAMGV